MAQFVWEGTSAAGKKIKGELKAQDVQAVFNILKAQKIIPNAKKIREKGKGLSMEIKIPGLEARVRSKDIVILTRQLATMVDAGLPLEVGEETTIIEGSMQGLKVKVIKIMPAEGRVGVLLEMLGTLVEAEFPEHALEQRQQHRLETEE